ncbi:MAG: transglutaminase-like domain-containing protein [Spirochaetia bacterium]|nr:transglutaminase-like domain-containing protein [Spirochaetia bacterium]
MSQTRLKVALPAPEECIEPTEFLNFTHPAVQSWLIENLPEGLSVAEKLQHLYYKVRDGWRYNPYTVHLEREKCTIDFLLTQKHAYCTPKAMLLAAFARAIGVPSRLGFGDVRNHLSSPRLIEHLRSENFAWHGFTELYLNNEWVACTPAFDKGLCRKFKVEPMEFDGRSDSLFQEFDKSGRKFMEYTRYRGVYSDLPFEEMFTSLAEIYPHLFENGMGPGSLYDEV